MNKLWIRAALTVLLTFVLPSLLFIADVISLLPQMKKKRKERESSKQEPSTNLLMADTNQNNSVWSCWVLKNVPYSSLELCQMNLRDNAET